MANQIPLVIADFETQLASAISAGATSLTLSSATDDDGNALAAGKYCFTINNGSSNKQYLIGQLNGTAVTSVVQVDRRGNETPGAEYAARAGAPVIISDFATIQRVADILRGQVNLDGSNPVTYDAEPTLSNRVEIATVGYVLDQVSGGAVSFDNQIISSSEATAGETVSAGDLLYFKTSDQEWYKADADASTTCQVVKLGIALGSGSDGVSITGGVHVGGVYTTSGLTAGSTYYVSGTAGSISTTAGAYRRQVGVALSTTKLYFNPKNETDSELGVPVGTVLPFAGSTAPTNFLLCYGQAISRTTYADLFALISTTYGVGDGATTFNLPDLRGRVIAALDNLGGVSADVVTDAGADSLGGTDGEEDHTLTTAEMPAHTHSISAISYSSGSSKATGANSGGNEVTATGSAGSDGAHNTMQPTIFMSYIIKAL